MADQEAQNVDFRTTRHGEVEKRTRRRRLERQCVSILLRDTQWAELRVDEPLENLDIATEYRTVHGEHGLAMNVRKAGPKVDVSLERCEIDACNWNIHSDIHTVSKRVTASSWRPFKRLMQNAFDNQSQLLQTRTVSVPGPDKYVRGTMRLPQRVEQLPQTPAPQFRQCESFFVTSHKRHFDEVSVNLGGA